MPGTDVEEPGTQGCGVRDSRLIVKGSADEESESRFESANLFLNFGYRVESSGIQIRV